MQVLGPILRFFCKFLQDLCIISLELLQFCMLIHKIQRKFFNMYKFWVFSKFAHEISNFLTYFDCPHHVWMWKVEKSHKQYNFISSHSWTVCSCCFNSKQTYGCYAHCLGLDMNGLLTRRNFWCIPDMLWSYMIPK